MSKTFKIAILKNCFGDMMAIFNPVWDGELFGGCFMGTSNTSPNSLKSYCAPEFIDTIETLTLSELKDRGFKNIAGMYLISAQNQSA